MFENALAAVEALDTHRTEWTGAGRYSDRGVTELVRGAAVAKGGAVENIVKARASAATRQVRIEAEKKRLVTPVVDKADVVGALLRQELRAYLRSLPDQERFRALDAADESTLSAVITAPAVLSGIPQHVVDTMVEDRARAANPERFAALEAEAEAAEILSLGADAATNSLRDTLGLGVDDPSFPRWFAEASAPFAEGIATGKVKAEPPADIDGLVETYRSWTEAERAAFTEKALTVYDDDGA